MTDEAIQPPPKDLLINQHDIAPHGHLLVNYLRIRLANDVNEQAHGKEVWPTTYVNQHRTEIILRPVGTPIADAPMLSVQEMHTGPFGYFCGIRLFAYNAEGVREQRGEVQSVRVPKYLNFFESLYTFLMSGKWINLPADHLINQDKS